MTTDCGTWEAGTLAGPIPSIRRQHNSGSESVSSEWEMGHTRRVHGPWLVVWVRVVGDLCGCEWLYLEIPVLGFGAPRLGASTTCGSCDCIWMSIGSRVLHIQPDRIRTGRMFADPGTPGDVSSISCLHSQLYCSMQQIAAQCALWQSCRRCCQMH